MLDFTSIFLLETSAQCVGTILLRDFLEPDEILDDRDRSVRMEEGEGILEPDEILDDRDRSVRYGGRRRYSRTR